MVGIYKITNPSGKIYIGQSINIEKRFNQYKKLRCKSQIILYRSLLKYTFQNHIFEIIEECDIELLNERERYWQDYYNVLENGLNCKTTSFESKTGNLSKETKNKIRYKAIGRKASEETKIKMSLSRKGKYSTYKGKKHTEETKNKISLSLLGNKRGCNKIMSENEKENLKNKFSKIILNLQTGVFYLGTKEAAFYNNLNHSTLKNRLNGNLKNNTNLIYC